MEFRQRLKKKTRLKEKIQQNLGENWTMNQATIKLIFLLWKKKLKNYMNIAVEFCCTHKNAKYPYPPIFDSSKRLFQSVACVFSHKTQWTSGEWKKNLHVRPKKNINEAWNEKKKPRKHRKKKKKLKVRAFFQNFSTLNINFIVHNFCYVYYLQWN